MKPETVSSELRGDWHERKVTYLSECAKDYAAEIEEATNIDKLHAVLDKWRRLVPDAVEKAKGLSNKDWQFVLLHKKDERYGEETSDLAGEILIPAVLLVVTMTARRFQVPWGAAFIRLREVKQIELRKGAWYRPTP